MKKSIEERIKELGEIFVGMRVEQADNNSIIYMTAKFPDGWIIPPDIEEKYNVSSYRDENDKDSSYFFAGLDVGFDVLLDAIEYTVRLNRIAEEKAKIFLQKTDELKKIISDDSNSVEALRGLKFVIPNAVNEENKPVADTKISKKENKGGTK